MNEIRNLVQEVYKKKLVVYSYRENSIAKALEISIQFNNQKSMNLG